MFHFIRLVMCSLFFNLGLLYAAFISLRREGGPSIGTPDVSSLKLWTMLLSMLAVSETLGSAICEAIPLYYEARCITVWVLLLLDPVGWAHMFDHVYSPAVSWVFSSLDAVGKSEATKLTVVWLISVASWTLSTTLSLGMACDAIQKENSDEVEAALEKLSCATLREGRKPSWSKRSKLE